MLLRRRLQRCGLGSRPECGRHALAAATDAETEAAGGRWQVRRHHSLFLLGPLRDRGAPSKQSRTLPPSPIPSHNAFLGTTEWNLCNWPLRHRARVCSRGTGDRGLPLVASVASSSWGDRESSQSVHGLHLCAALESSGAEPRPRPCAIAPLLRPPSVVEQHRQRIAQRRVAAKVTKRALAQRPCPPPLRLERPAGHLAVCERARPLPGTEPEPVAVDG
jgi:hypothetical protein